MPKDLAYYRTLPYHRRIDKANDEGVEYWVAEYEELPGCVATGEDQTEAVANLNTAFDDYISAKLEWGSDIPEPAPREVEIPKVESVSDADSKDAFGSGPETTSNRIDDTAGFRA